MMGSKSHKPRHNPDNKESKWFARLVQVMISPDMREWPRKYTSYKWEVVTASQEAQALRRYVSF